MYTCTHIYYTYAHTLLYESSCAIEQMSIHDIHACNRVRARVRGIRPSVCMHG